MELALAILFVGLLIAGVFVGRVSKRLTWSFRRSELRASALPRAEEAAHLSYAARQAPQGTMLKGRCNVEDGDTIYIRGSAIRLAGIDAPGLDQPYGKRAKFALIALCRGQEVTAVFADEQSYAREVATCYLPDGRDLSAEMVRLGLALDWRKFSGGKYRSLEPPDARRKLWRVAAKHKGLYPGTDPSAGP